MGRGTITVTLGIAAACFVGGLLIRLQPAFIRDEPQIVLSVYGAAVTPDMATEPTPLQFPIWIEGTTVMAQSLACYEGDMLEESSDLFLVDAAALLVHNFGNQMVSQVQVTLKVGDEELVFYGTDIPAGASTLIIEKEGKIREELPCTDYSGWAELEDAVNLLELGLTVEQADMDSVIITNTSAEVMKNILLYYKNYVPEGELYLGGITYQLPIGTLEPGCAVKVSPYRYVNQYSKVVRAESVT